MNGDASPSNTEFWLYGYGSLIWKPPPHFDKRVPGYVHGYVRRFWQARYVHLISAVAYAFLTPPSEDHRGTPEAPGRVATLIERSYWDTLGDHHEDAPEKVWGVAYHIKPEKVDEVKEYLDIREINGYSIHWVPFHPADGSESIRTLVYIGTPDNEQFVGVQDPQKLAEHILHSKGPSGLNKDYLLNLDQALKELAPESRDHHIQDLAERVRALEGKGSPDGEMKSDEGEAFNEPHSTKEAEEIETGPH